MIILQPSTTRLKQGKIQLQPQRKPSLESKLLDLDMPGRKVESSSYRYGFNGQEKSTELDPHGNSMTAEFWQYDARLGRRWNVDPVFKAFQSGYSCYSGNPILMVDKRGDSDSTYKTPDNGTITLPDKAKILSRYESGYKYSLTGTQQKIDPTIGSVREFEYNNEVYSARYNPDGSFLQYQSDNAREHYISYYNKTIPSFKESKNSSFQAFAYGALLTPTTKVNPWVAGGVVVLAGIAWLAGDDVTDLTEGISMTRPLAPPVPPESIPRVLPPPSPIILYRGVHKDHPDYQNALQGIATPRGGNANADDHAAGNSNSIYTSWTMFPIVANYHANKSGPGGVVLIKAFYPGQFLINFGGVEGEGEYLVPGTVYGATVTKPTGSGYPYGY